MAEFLAQVFNTLIGNGYCNDETNDAENNYDGGDCCGYNVNKEYCIVCECHIEGTCLARAHPLVRDRYCNDETNIAVCGYDGGDCCGSCVIKKYCSECACLSGASNALHYYNRLLVNGFCNDETLTNNLECTYDGGDCCLLNLDTDSNCHGGGVITSPGFPEPYDSFLDLTWLIQVQMGQTIETNFLSFDLYIGDSLAIYDGFSSPSFMLGRYYWNSIPLSLVSSSNEVLILFQSYYSGNWNSHSGFKMEYNPTGEQNTSRPGLGVKKFLKPGHHIAKILFFRTHHL